MGIHDWRELNGELSAWFSASSPSEAAALAGHACTLTDVTAADARTTGVRVRVETPAAAEAVSVMADGLGLRSDPSAPQSLSVVLEAVDPTAIQPFWQQVLGYTAVGDRLLTDPLRRGPNFRFEAGAEPAGPRDRFHADVSRPERALAGLNIGEARGPYGLCHTDAEGNEVDVVPGGSLSEDAGAEDWSSVFSAMAVYRAPSADAQRDLAAAAASLADEVGFPLLIDIRPGLTILDSGKDMWDADAHGLDLDFTQLASGIQTVARGIGAVAETGLPLFVQLMIDAADVPAVRAFWKAALDYAEDPREGVADLIDPRRLGPELLFQPLEADDERLQQRNRATVALTVPHDCAGDRCDAALRPGGRLLAEGEGRWRIADPEGNELLIETSSRR